MVTVTIAVMGAVQDKLGVNTLLINTNGKKSISEILALILEKLEVEGKKNFITYVWDPKEPYTVKEGMVLLLNGLHVRSSREELEKIIEKDCELSIFTPLGGG